MKKLLPFLLFFITQFSYGQINLVPNPSFEVYDTCPAFIGEVNRVQSWFEVSQTPDYFNSCTSNWTASVPLNGLGYQHAHTGNAYCGMACYAPGSGNLGREYIGTQLIAPLIVGQKYFISFFLSLSGGAGWTLGSNKYGCKFSITPFVYNSVLPDNTSFFYSDTIITDTTNWVLINGNFIADSAYNYLALGNFFDNAHTDTMGLVHNSLYSYNYIDDVCLSRDSLYAETWTGVNEKKNDNPILNVYPNPFVDYISIDFNTLTEPYNIEIDNMLGERVFSKQKIINPNEHIAIADIKSNILFVKIIYQNKQFNYKLIKL